MAKTSVTINDKAFLASLDKALVEIGVGVVGKAHRFAGDVVELTAAGVGYSATDDDHHKHLKDTYRIMEEAVTPVQVYEKFGSDSDHALVHETGSRPHIIKIRTKKVLANRGTGQVFGPIVHHPGTKPNPVFRTAIGATIERFNWRL